MKFRYFFFIIIFSVINFIASAGSSDTSKQDTSKTEIRDISKFFFNDFKLNPAFTGINKGENFLIESGIDKPLMTNYHDFYRPQFYSFLFDAASGEEKNFGFGIYFNEAKSGPVENISAGVSFSNTFDLSENNSSSFYHKLSIGGSMEYNKFYLYRKGITTGDMIDPRYGFIYFSGEGQPDTLSKHYFSLSAGILYYNPCFYFGLSVLNINKPDIGLYSLSKIPMEFNFSLGGNINLSENFSFNPSLNSTIILRYKGKLNSYSPAITFSYKRKIYSGLSYMDLNKIGFHAGCVLAKHLTLLATCALSLNNELYQFGTISYLGGKIMYNFK